MSLNIIIMRFIILFIICIYFYTGACQKKGDVNPLPYFRRRVEKITNDPIKKVTDDSHGNLLSLLVSNVKELFNEYNDVKGDAQYHEGSTSKLVKAEYEKPTTVLEASAIEVTTIITDTEPTENVLPKIDDKSNEKVVTTTMGPVIRNIEFAFDENTNDLMVYDNASLIQTTNQFLDKPTATESLEVFETTKVAEPNTVYYEVMEKTEIIEPIEKFASSFLRADISNVTTLTSNSSYALDTNGLITEKTPKKTCIYCDNILNDNCRDPKNKIVPSIVCKRESDICYSLHTPFGLVDRGCFNVNHNLTTYVCSCNLCNYIPISEMPYLFSHKQDWIDNIFELSRTKQFRQSIFKDMACLQCEVNKTTLSTRMMESVDCLEGNIEHLPVEECKENEICAVKALRADGYIWRGCIKRPLYNYWISLCDHDLCNFEKLLSIYQPEF